MAEIINLNHVRKAKAKAEKDATAATNRVKFGRTKAERQGEAARQAIETKKHDAHKRDGED